jgi:protein-disulfide isomerase-like protein with CxxC motif
VVTIFAGAHIKQGEYSEGKGITHVTILRTIEAMYGLPKAGKQQINAANYGISDDDIITDVFQIISNRKPK